MPGPVVWGSCFPTDEATCKECAGIINFDRAMHVPPRIKEDPCIGCRINQDRINAGERAREWGY